MLIGIASRGLRGATGPKDCPSGSFYINGVCCVSNLCASNTGATAAQITAAVAAQQAYTGPYSGYVDTLLSTNSGSAPVSAGYAPSVSLLDKTNAFGYNVGDTFSVSLKGGPPNTTVSVAQYKNGAATPTATNIGTSDANGNFVLTNTWKTTDVGSYAQYWKYGDANSGSGFQAPVLTFNVVPAVASASSGSTDSTADTTTTTPSNSWLLYGGIAALALFLYSSRN